MICEKCGGDYETIIVKIVEANGEHYFCPNCLAATMAGGGIFRNDPDLICDVTGKHGAISYDTNGEHYYLEKDIFRRLMCGQLKPEEYKILVEKYSADNFMLHDDFYDENGHALR